MNRRSAYLNETIIAGPFCFNALSSDHPVLGAYIKTPQKATFQRKSPENGSALKVNFSLESSHSGCQLRWGRLRQMTPPDPYLKRLQRNLSFLSSFSAWLAIHVPIHRESRKELRVPSSSGVCLQGILIFSIKQKMNTYWSCPVRNLYTFWNNTRNMIWQPLAGLAFALCQLQWK